MLTIKILLIKFFVLNQNKKIMPLGLQYKKKLKIINSLYPIIYQYKYFFYSKNIYKNHIAFVVNNLFFC